MAEDYEFTTPKDFPKPDDIKADGDVHRFLADIECTGTDDDGTMHWEIKALDGVKLPDTDEDEGANEGSGDEMDNYDDSQDEPSEGAPKDSKGVAAMILAPPK